MKSAAIAFLIGTSLMFGEVFAATPDDVKAVVQTITADHPSWMGTKARIIPYKDETGKTLVITLATMPGSENAVLRNAFWVLARVANKDCYFFTIDRYRDGTIDESGYQCLGSLDITDGANFFSKYENGPQGFFDQVIAAVIEIDKEKDR